MAPTSKPHRYALVIVHPPNEQQRAFYSRQPFGAFHVGDEVSRWSYETPPPNPPFETRLGGVVRRVLREVAEDEQEILDTTWVYLESTSEN